MFIPAKDALQPAKIKIIGVGGAGGNAINRMISYDFNGVDYIAANTDQQILSVSSAPTKIQLGKTVASGLGVGGDPEKGKKSAEESKDEIREAIEGADMLFITAGMGGGTGTGAAPIIAELAKEMDILTVAIVTKPFNFEGKKRMNHAQNGISILKDISDTALVIPNEKLKEISEPTTPLTSVFEQADNILYQAAKGISDIIITPGLVNRDFADVKTVMSYRGDAVIGMGYAKGEARGASASQIALDCPILEDSSVEGAGALLVTITGPDNLSISDIEDSMTVIRERAGEDAEMIFGAIIDNNLEDEIRLTVVATGINQKREEKTTENTETLDLFKSKNDPDQKENKEEGDIEPAYQYKRTKAREDDLDTPTFLRRAID
ncbi:MAG: cell division protein FtsZ [bacterium]